MYHLILHYTFREQNTSQSRASWRTASPNQNLLHLRDFISIHPSTPCESEAARTVPSTETVARDSVGISWTGGRPMDVKPIKWRLTGNSWAGSPTCKPSPTEAFHKEPFTEAHSHLMPWFLDAKSPLTRIQTNKLPSTLSPIYQQIIGSDIAPARHIPEKASVEPSAAQATLSSVAAVSHASIEDFKDALTWKANPSAPNEILQCFHVFPSSTTVLDSWIRKTMFVCALFMKHPIIALIPGATRIKIMVK